MDVLIVLFAAFIISALLSKVIKKNFRWKFSGNLAMCIMLFFTAIGHVLFTPGMAMMIPSFIPLKTELVYITGIMEAAFGVLLLFPKYRKVTGVILILFFILILPANIYAKLNYVNLKTAAYDGDGPGYLWFRIPLQVFFIVWVFYFSVKKR